MKALCLASKMPLQV